MRGNYILIHFNDKNTHEEVNKSPSMWRHTSTRVHADICHVVCLVMLRETDLLTVSVISVKIKTCNFNIVVYYTVWPHGSSSIWINIGHNKFPVATMQQFNVFHRCTTLVLNMHFTFSDQLIWPLGLKGRNNTNPWPISSSLIVTMSC